MSSVGGPWGYSVTSYLDFSGISRGSGQMDRTDNIIYNKDSTGEVLLY